MSYHEMYAEKVFLPHKKKQTKIQLNILDRNQNVDCYNCVISFMTACKLEKPHRHKHKKRQHRTTTSCFIVLIIIGILLLLFACSGFERCAAFCATHNTNLQKNRTNRDKSIRMKEPTSERVWLFWFNLV